MEKKRSSTTQKLDAWIHIEANEFKLIKPCIPEEKDEKGKMRKKTCENR